MSSKTECKCIKKQLEPDVELIGLKRDGNGFLDFKRFTVRNEFFRA